MIIKAPLKTDAAGKCSRWWVKFYNKQTRKPEMHTVRGTRADALKLERALHTKQDSGDYIPRKDRKTVQEVHALFKAHRAAHQRRSSSIANYESSMDLYVLPKFGTKQISTVRKGELTTYFNDLRTKGGKSAATVNAAVKAFKSLLNFALDNGHGVERNPLQRFPKYKRAQGERTVKRGVFSEAETRAILDAARPRERALIGLLVFTGLRPGEVYALDWQSLDLDAAKINVRRNWDSRGKVFNPPKTEAGVRAVPMSDWVLRHVEAHRAAAKDTAPDALVFSTVNRERQDSGACDQALALLEQGISRSEIAKQLGVTASRVSQYIWHARRRRKQLAEGKAQSVEGQPLNSSNVRRDIWLPLKKRAKVRDLDMYSLRHTFVTYARSSGAEAFNVARAIGHSKSVIVDSIYANHTLASGIAPISDNVTQLALGGRSKSKAKLRVIAGGKRAAGGAQ